jgi:hypothetical protein
MTSDTRECQNNDWKNGSPPHKKICGKEASIPSKPSPSRRVYDGPKSGRPPRKFPPSSPGYTRSPALLRQLKMLEEEDTEPESDYIFMRPYPHPDVGIRCDGAREKFREYFEEAIHDQSPRAVLMMYSLLAPAAVQFPFYGADGLKVQINDEFGFQVDGHGRPRE